MTKKIIEYVQDLKAAQTALDAASLCRDAAERQRNKAKAWLEEAQARVRTHYTAQSIDFNHASTSALAAWAIWSMPMTCEHRACAFRELGIESAMRRIDEPERDRWDCSPSGTVTMAVTPSPARWACDAQTYGGPLSEIVVNGCVLHQSA